MFPRRPRLASVAGSPELKRYSAQIERLRARGLSTEEAEALTTRWEREAGSPPDREDPKAAEFWYTADAWLRKNCPGPTRPDESTLQLALTIFGDVLESPGLQPLRVDLKITPTGTTSTITEPAHRDRRDLLGVLRKLDLRDHDARLDRVYRIIERRGVQPDWKDGFERARDAWAARNETLTWQIEDPDIPRYREEDSPAWINPRDAFGLWVYGEVVHDDYAKELRWRRLDDALAKPGVRSMAHDFATLMIIQAEYLNRLIRHGLIDPISTGGGSAPSVKAKPA